MNLKPTIIFCLNYLLLPPEEPDEPEDIPPPDDEEPEEPEEKELLRETDPADDPPLYDDLGLELYDEPEEDDPLL